MSLLAKSPMHSTPARRCRGVLWVHHLYEGTESFNQELAPFGTKANS